MKVIFNKKKGVVVSKQLTKKQQKILKFIKDFIERHSYPPSYGDIAEYFKVRKPTILDHLNALQKKGYIRRQTYRARTIELVEKFPVAKPDYVEIPIVGKISAGTPLLAVENIEGTIKIDRSILKNTDSFALWVKGDSMIEAGIRDGDLVIIKMQPVVEKNEVAAVLIEDEVTLKYYSADANAIKLTPANSRMKPIIIPRGTKEVRVLGKAIGLFRKL
ncbi:MAG: transcriptional repressor LexA [candidate division WOR-3 bacterium]|nr:transcriptional repressor LexA [candidate division WOR-3 bacterium]